MEFSDSPLVPPSSGSLSASDSSDSSSDSSSRPTKPGRSLLRRVPHPRHHRRCLRHVRGRGGASARQRRKRSPKRRSRRRQPRRRRPRGNADRSSFQVIQHRTTRVRLTPKASFTPKIDPRYGDAREQLRRGWKSHTKKLNPKASPCPWSGRAQRAHDGKVACMKRRTPLMFRVPLLEV